VTSEGTHTTATRFGSCAYSPAPNRGSDPDQARIFALAQGINKGAGALSNPNTYGCFFGASVLSAGAILTAGPAASLAAAYAPEIGNTISELSNFITSDLQIAQGATVAAVGAAVVGVSTAITNYNPCTH